MNDQNSAMETERPALLDTLSTTQMDELEQQYAQNDRDGWNRLCEEYGWTPDTGAAIWTWFGQSDRPANS
jgi:hypothetical protein